MAKAAPYFLRYIGHPLCDYMGCQAGQAHVAKAGVSSCSYPSRAKALAAMRKLNALDGYAGSVRICEGECPRLAEDNSAEAYD